jgi:hypothetical protein
MIPAPRYHIAHPDLSPLLIQIVALHTTLREFQTKAQFIRVSGASQRESHVHDVTITRESPNYPSRT